MKQSFFEIIRTLFDNIALSITQCHAEITMDIPRDQLLTVMLQCRDNSAIQLNQLIDLCAVDYLTYGLADWDTQTVSETGFCRGVAPLAFQQTTQQSMRFAVIYHLLSTVHNERLRIRVYLSESDLIINSVHSIWKVANWFEREAYDLYGILFKDHPDLRRILTDYGFIGHPFRKDFPLSGHVEMRYDATLARVIYEPVDIEPRVLVPKVIRHDSRYVSQEDQKNA